ncbi:hypothetical protein [Streptomyces sp. NPDC091259]
MPTTTCLGWLATRTRLPFLQYLTWLISLLRLTTLELPTVCWR